MRLARRFVIAAMIGSAVSVVPMTLFTIAVAGMYVLDAMDHGKDIWPAIYIVILPSIVAVPIVTVAMVLVGLPVHWLLIRTHTESGLAYSLAGGLAGLSIPMVFVVISGSENGFSLSMLGLVSGAATGHAWWRYRPTIVQ
ncbi:MAG: hypothetical protein EOP69_01195 [Spirochaetia bacterium]|nr:MAG: hypothetical protein EOP69_01195 [Spirochaetia bacterium]